MNITLDYLTGNRKWLIRDFSVWGQSDLLNSAILATDDTTSGDSIIFMYELSGGQSQVVEFSDLIDHRGNRLPESIDNAEIIIIPKSRDSCFVAGTIGSSSFRLSKISGDAADAIVDLLIMEMN
jgi:hypothetical protein